MIKKSKIYCAIIILLALLLGIEIYLRLNSDITRVTGKGMFIPDDILGYRLKPGFSSYFETREGEVLASINEKGLRGPSKSYENPEGNKRVLVMGGSIPFGSGFSFEESYTSKLEKKLKAKGEKVEIINGAVPAYQFSQQYDFYKEELYKYNPDVVLLSLVLDDIGELNRSKLKENVIKYDNIQKNEGKIKIAIKKSCYTCVFLYGLYLNEKKKHANHALNAWEDEAIYSNFAEKLSEFSQNLSQSNISLVIVVFPYNQQFTNSLNYTKHPQEKLKALSSGINATYIDILPYLDDRNYKNYYMTDDKIHLNGRGFDKIEPLIYKELASEQ